MNKPFWWDRKDRDRLWWVRAFVHRLELLNYEDTVSMGKGIKGYEVLKSVWWQQKKVGNNFDADALREYMRSKYEKLSV